MYYLEGCCVVVYDNCIVVFVEFDGFLCDCVFLSDVDCFIDVEWLVG